MTSILKWLALHKDAFLAVQALATIGAVMVGAGWAYFTFRRKREKFPRAEITHKFDAFDIEESKRWLRVELTLKNIGESVIDVESVTNFVQQVVSVATHLDGSEFKAESSHESPEIPWPLIREQSQLNFDRGQRHIEPGETDDFQFDFLLGADVEILVVYSHVRNVAIRPNWLVEQWRKFSKALEGGPETYSPNSIPIGWMKTSTVHVATILSPKTMNKNQNDGPTETRQGTPKVIPQQTSGDKAQGVPKQPPTNSGNPKKK